MKVIFNLATSIILLNIIFIKSNTKNDIHSSHFCNVDKIDIKIKYPSKSNKMENIIRNLNLNDSNNEVFKPIRIYIDKTYLTYQKENNPSINSIYSIITKGLDNCTSALNKLLKVKPLQNKINFITNEDLNNWNFNLNYVDSKIKQGGTGVSTDLLILPKFSINENINFEYIEGYPVYFDESNNRPIVGILNINSKISLNLKNIDYLLQSILLHELTHILGFLISLFKYYPGGEAKTIKFAEESRTKVEKGFIITPNVISIAKKYFNCESITGVELERNSIDIIAESHWEARILLGEYMNSEFYTPEQVVSEFTLALLEDSGWYKANYYTGGLMRFGKNQGCFFLNKDCFDLESSELRNEFFSLFDTSQPSCSSGRQSRTYAIIQISETFSLNQYNRKTKFIGKKSADYCWVNDLSIDEENKMLFVGNCQRGGGYYGENVLFNDGNKYNSSFFPKELGEIYSKNSFCALSSIYPIGKNNEEKKEYEKIYDEIIHSMCYPMFCTNSSLTIQIYDHFVVCPRGGGKVEVGGEYTGFLFCPDYNLICTGTIMCNDMFDCIEKKSLLKENTYSYDYTKKTYQSMSVIKKDEDILFDYEKENDGICPKFCITCKINRKCYNCTNNMVLIGKHKNDLEPITCNKTSDITSRHYFDSLEKVYYECEDGCESCENENNCLSCSYGYIKNSNSKCEEIIQNCEKYNNDFTECLKCKNNSILIGNDKTECHKVKNIDEYYTEDGISYFPCDKEIKNCAKCLNKTFCIKCEDNYFFIGKNRQKCYKENEIEKNKYIMEEDGLTYKLCSEVLENCDECKNKTFCDKCQSDFIIVKDNNKNESCKEKISEEKYYTDIEEGRTIYHLCSDELNNCEECTNKYNCSKCKENYYFIGNERKNCYNEKEIEKDKYYFEENETIYYSCNSLIENCDKCINKTFCTKCEENYFFIGEDRTKCYKDKENEINKEEYYSEDNGTSYYKCDEIIENCNKCLNKSYCIQCKNKYYLIGDEKDKCYDEKIIDKKKYFIENNGTSLTLCNSSIINCEECSNKTFCVKCEDNYIFLENDKTKCINFSQIDKDKYYKEDNDTNYYPCNYEIDNCELCINKSYCIKCKENYYFIEDDRTKCYKKEGDNKEKEGYFTEDNGISYHKCNETIRNCIKCLNRSYCEQCEEDYYFIEDKKDICIQKSEINDKKYFIDDNNTILYLCNSSLLNCDECLNKSYCQKCQNNHYFIGNDHSKCINESEIKEDNKYYKDENAQTYYPCNMNISNCDKCLNNSYCIKCKDEYFFIGENRNECFKEKKEQEYLSEDNGTSFYPCDTFIKNCEKCLNKSFCLKCKSPYFLLGKNHTKCFDLKPEDENKYFTENEGISFILCNDTINNCEMCNNSQNCIKCEENYLFVNNDKTKCLKKDEIINNSKYYFDENEKLYYSCNNSIIGCNECFGKYNCSKCNESYYFLGNDRKKCINDLDIKKYYSEDNGISYYPCNYSIGNCNECSGKNNCSKCDDGYFIIADNKERYCNIIENFDNYYTKDNGTSFTLCNSSINYCSKCENEFHCKECYNNYYLIKNNYTTKCYDKKEIEKDTDKYFKDDNSSIYYSCDLLIENCDKCINKTFCTKCKENYFFIGENREKCYKEKENESGNQINKEEYYTEDNGTSYYKCDEKIENCNKCLNKSYCTKCNDEYYLIGDEKNKCHKINEIELKNYYLEDNDTILILCNKSIPNCEECQNKKKCIKCNENYFFIGENRNFCYNKIDEKKYFSEDNGKSYYLCKDKISHCEECLNKNTCTKCEKNFYLSNDYSSCLISSEITNYCKVIKKVIPYSNNKLNISLIEQNINSFILDINKSDNNNIVHHLINHNYNYSILIFKSSVCTYSLLKDGYYYINNDEINEKLFEYPNIDINNYIFCFINYKEKNSLFIYNQKDINLIEINENNYQLSDFKYEINNNFTSYLINRFGDAILNKIMLNNIDIFNISETKFTDLCSNFDIYGIDIPLKLRIQEIYLGEEKEKIICKDESCTLKNKTLLDFIGICQCEMITNSIENIYNEDKKNKNYEIQINSSKVKQAFNIFTCTKEGFNKNSFKNNAGFNISLIMIIIQIILSVFFILFKKDIKSLNFISNPPKLIIHSDSIKEIEKENESNGENSHEEEQNNQSKDLNDSDYDEEIYIDDENVEKKKRNKKKECMMEIIEEEKSNKKLKSEESKRYNKFLFKKEAFQETNDKDDNSQNSLKTISKLNKEKNEINENRNHSKEEKKRKIIILKSTEQNLITEENKVSISQMKTMEDFMSKPKKKRSIKNISLTNKLVLNKKHYHSIHNYNKNINSNNSNILKQITDNKNEKNDKNKLTLTSNDIDNPIRIRDIILKNRFIKKDSLVSNKNLIMKDSDEEEEEKKNIKKRPKSNNKENRKLKRKEMKKNRSKESYKNFINKKENNDVKSSEHSLNNKSIHEKIQSINVIIKKDKFKKEINISLIDYISLNEAKNRDFRPIYRLYWNILSLRHPIINIFSFISIFNITMSYTPYQIKIIKIIFMLMINMFINALLLTQNYFINKFYYFNNKYNIMNTLLEKNISSREKINYSMNHSFPRVLISFLISYVVQVLIEHIFFCERKNYYKLFIYKGINKSINNSVNDMMRKIRIKYYIFLLINYILMIIIFIYLANFSSVYISGTTDYIGAGIWTFISLQIFPFISSLVISLLRYYGLRKLNNKIYRFSQILSF